MLIGYMRVSKADGSQTTNLQKDALLQAGVDEQHLYEDHASGKNDKRVGLDACLKALREGDVLVVWKLDRLGRNLSHLVKTVTKLSEQNIGLRVLTGQGANSELIRERTKAGLMAARARGRNGGRKFQLTKSQVRMAQVAMQSRDTSVAELCKELEITRSTLYRYVSPKGELRERGIKILNP